MFEFLIVFGCIFLAVAFVVFLAKLLFSLLLLPIKLGFWLLKGALGLILLVPLVLISIGAASLVFPLVISLVALPVVAVVVGIVLLVKLFA
ncbi:MAG: hypothetical protein JSW58_16540 [Candidatus Latescibacterota bacterium]|nr:MAG: hypothetical protein JSW58_16540 [Candidatus Latescibacterota bacterium]